MNNGQSITKPEFLIEFFLLYKHKHTNRYTFHTLIIGTYTIHLSILLIFRQVLSECDAIREDYEKERSSRTKNTIHIYIIIYFKKVENNKRKKEGNYKEDENLKKRIQRKV